MSKRHRKISLILIGILLTLLTILSFAEPPEAPNQLITENPYKEVKTVEANKNREHAEMNISVDKLNLKNLDAYKISDTEYYIELPAEENLKENETYYVSKSIEDLPDIYSVNGKKTITNLNRFKDYSVETADFSYGFTDNFILIDRAPIGTKNFIVSKLDKSSGEIKKVYEIDRFKTANISELQGETVNENSQIAFKLTDEMMDIFSENQREIKVVKRLKDIFNKENRFKRNLDKNILNYELNRENKELIVDSDNSVEELKIVVLNSGRIEKIYKGNKSKKSLHQAKATISFDSNNFAMLQGYGTGYHGWSVVHPTSTSNFDAEITYLEGHNIEMTNKNGQPKQAKITGKVYPITSKDLGKKVKYTVGNESREITLFTSSTDITGGQYFTNITGLGVGLDYDALTDFNGGMYLGLYDWDLEAKDFNIKVEASTFTNEYSVKIPEFNGEVYYDKNILQTLSTEVDYNNKTLKGNIIRKDTSETQFKFNIGTKDYDLVALGKDGSYINLNLKVPKQIDLDMLDEYGVKKTIPFSVTVEVDSSKGYILEKGNNYYIYSPNDGRGRNSEIKATVTLKAMLKNSNISSNHIVGRDLNLVSVGAKSKSSVEKYSTIIDNINLKIRPENFSEVIDVSNTPILGKVYSKNGYDDFVKNEYIVILKEGSREIFKTTFDELSKIKKAIPEAGVNMKYNLTQDAHKNQFEFEKVKALNYNKILKLEVFTSNGQLLYHIDFNVINKVGFEILPGKGALDFGDFFPGDIKKSESLIEFKNPNGAKIDVSLNPTNTEKMFKVGVNITPDTTIPLSNIQIKDLKTESNNTNSFRISGEAKTTPKTEIGEYKGELEVIITVIP